MQDDTADRAQRIVEMADKRLPRESLALFVREILDWNPRLGLVSKLDPESVITRLIGRSVALWEFVEANAAPPTPYHIADIGPGAGFPGVIWRLLVPSLRLTLIERNSSRTVFLERTLRRLGFEDVAVIESNLRAYAQSEDHSEFDLVTMLAVAPPARIGEWVEPLLRGGGYLVTSRSTNETILQTVGTSLQLSSSASVADGVHLLYRKPPSQ